LNKDELVETSSLLRNHPAQTQIFYDRLQTDLHEMTATFNTNNSTRSAYHLIRALGNARNINWKQPAGRYLAAQLSTGQ
jgi:hypothetical protein